MFKVLSTGLQTTFQDLGRFGYRNLGVPLSGVMDQNMAKYANSLLSNPTDEAVIEFTMLGPTLKILEETEIAVVGIGFSLHRNKETISLNKSQSFKQGDTLKIGVTSVSMRGYLAVRGGFKIPEVLGSASFNPIICPQLAIEKGRIIEIKKDPKWTVVSHLEKMDFSFYNSSKIEVFKGPEFDLLSIEMQKKFFDSEFKIEPQSNRMAVLLAGDHSFSAPEIITSPVQPGTVQLTPSGMLMVLMRDAQTSGGYARVLQLSGRAINLLAQKVSNSKISFKLL